MEGTTPKFRMREATPTCLSLYFEGGLSWEDRDVLANEVGHYITTRPNLRHAIVDLAGVQFINSAGLGALFQLSRRVREKQGCLAFANVPPLMARVFNAVGLDRLAIISTDVPTAISACENGTVPGGVRPNGSGPPPAAPGVRPETAAGENEAPFTAT